jgi:predicted house-cleaning noncanonical NTP pyrophosphatase (MazG superfamily)
MKKYNKLVRDRIPEIIEADGHKCKYHVADRLDEYEDLLYDKLKEEVEELILKPCAEEIADILEVIETIARFNNISIDEIKNVKIKKKSDRGGFNGRIVLESTEKILERDGSHVTLKIKGFSEKLRPDFKTSGSK